MPQQEMAILPYYPEKPITASAVKSAGEKLENSRSTALGDETATLPGRGKRIIPFVLGMAVVPAHPFQRDAVAVKLDLQAFPEVAVFDRLLGGCLPAVFPPAREPFLFHGVAQILRIRVQRDRARLFQLFEPRDGRHDFHTVVRGVRVAAGELLFMPIAAQDAAPAAPSWIAEA